MELWQDHMVNRKDKVCYNLWLTKQEEKLLIEGLQTIPTIGWTIVKKAQKRGDFEKV